MRIVTVYPNFSNEGGAQNVALQIASHLNKNVIVLYDGKEITPKYRRDNILFEKISIRNIIKYSKDSIFISHSRNYTTFLLLLGYIFNIKVIHIAHNTFTSLRKATLFPPNIIAISSGVRDNLIDYFKVKESRITFIWNGLRDTFNPSKIVDIKDPYIKILLAGRICKVKQQVELVRNLKGRVSSNVKFYFAGEGENVDQLMQVIGDSDRFEMLGQINITEEIYKYDYVCLFSEQEGLPLSLIEGTMYCKPLITNSLQAVQDVNIKNVNGFVYNDWEDLIEGLKILPNRYSKEYRRLSANSRKIYEERFTESSMIEKYKEVIKKLYQNE